jgi:hypothetical protein
MQIAHQARAAVAGSGGRPAVGRSRIAAARIAHALRWLRNLSEGRN